MVVGTGDYFINDTRLELASQLERRRGLRLGLIRPPDTLSSHRRQLAHYRNDLLVGSEPPRRPVWPVNPLLLAGAAQTQRLQTAGRRCARPTAGGCSSGRADSLGFRGRWPPSLACTRCSCW